MMGMGMMNPIVGAEIAAAEMSMMGGVSYLNFSVIKELILKISKTITIILILMN